MSKEKSTVTDADRCALLQQKDCRFELRLSKAQRDKLKKQAGKLGVTESDYLRLLIANGDQLNLKKLVRLC